MKTILYIITAIIIVICIISYSLFKFNKKNEEIEIEKKIELLSTLQTEPEKVIEEAKSDKDVETQAKTEL